MVKSIIGEVVTYYPNPAYQVKTDGVSTNTRKYYQFGGNNIALRENGALTWLLSDHLNSTSITANEDGSMASEIRYTAFGEVRTANGVTVTDNKYTGQRQEAEIGLYYYVARWYDPVIAHFLQADTIVPEPGSSLSLNRYTYVNHNPIKFTDPSGHYFCEGATSCKANRDHKAKPGQLLQQVFTSYSISFGGNWISTDRLAVAVAITSIANSMASVDPYRRAPAEVFKAEFGNLTFTMKGQGDGGCLAGTNGFTCYGASGKMTGHLVAHELAHTFSQRNGTNPYDDMQKASVTDDRGVHVFGTPEGGKEYSRTLHGFISPKPPYLYHGPPYSGGGWTDWDSNGNNTARNKDFADTFSNWVFNSFDYSSTAYGAGTARYDWMTTNMAEWLR